MDRRYSAFRLLTHATGPVESTTTSPPSHEAQALYEGQHSEFWHILKAEIDQQIRAAESRFLDTLAKDYETYVAWWSRRQALIAVLAIPETAKTEQP